VLPSELFNIANYVVFLDRPRRTTGVLSKNRYLHDPDELYGIELRKPVMSPAPQAPMPTSKLPSPMEFRERYEQPLPNRAIDIFIGLMQKYVDPQRLSGYMPKTEFSVFY
jgi:hypothetical protein